MSHLKEEFALDVDGRELATILAALRFHQDENLQGGSEIPDQVIRDIAADGGALVPLSFAETSMLCEKLNCGHEARGQENSE